MRFWQTVLVFAGAYGLCLIIEQSTCAGEIDPPPPPASDLQLIHENIAAETSADLVSDSLADPPPYTSLGLHAYFLLAISNSNRYRLPDEDVPPPQARELLVWPHPYRAPPFSFV